MKKLLFAVLAVSFTLMGVSCQKENELNGEETLSSVTFIAAADEEVGTKATLLKNENALKFIWQKGDEIRLFCTKNDEKLTSYSYEATLKSGDNTNLATFEAKSAIVGFTLNYAAFSADLSGGHTNTYITYESAISDYVPGAIYTPMIAVPENPFVIAEGANYESLYFNHVGGALKFTLKDVPAGVNSVVFTASDNAVFGKYNINAVGLDAAKVKDGTWIKGNVESPSNTLTFNFGALNAEQAEMVFYVPVIAGANLAGTLTVDVMAASGKVQSFNRKISADNPYPVKRAVVGNLGTFTVTEDIPTLDTPTAVYQKVTAEPTGGWAGQYLIVCEESGVAFNGSLATTDLKGDDNEKEVTISENTISVMQDDFYFTISLKKNSEVYYVAAASSGQRIGQSKDQTGINANTSSTTYTNKFAINSDGTVTMESNGAILGYGNKFSYFASNSEEQYSAISLYKKVEQTQQ